MGLRSRKSLISSTTAQPQTFYASRFEFTSVVEKPNELNEFNPVKSNKNDEKTPVNRCDFQRDLLTRKKLNITRFFRNIFQKCVGF